VRYWWVNQNQTFRQEIDGGYLWSPKRNANGAKNTLYEFMREVAPGDLIFSFVDTRIVAIGHHRILSLPSIIESAPCPERVSGEPAPTSTIVRCLLHIDRADAKLKRDAADSR
jgi:hypothetical protein